MAKILNLFSLSLFLSSVSLMIIGFYIFKKKNIKGALYFANLVFVGAFWAFCSAHEIAAYGEDVKIFFSQLSYLGIAFTGYFWLMFCLVYAQYPTKLINVFRYTFVIPAFLTVIAVFSNSIHHAIWSQTYQSIASSGYSPVVYVHAWGFYSVASLIYIEILTGLVVLTRYGLAQKDTVKKNRVLSVMVAMLVPWLASISYIVFLNDISGYDPTPFGLLVTAGVVAFTVYKQNLFEFLPTAKETVYQTIDSGIVIVDKNMTVVDMNAMGRRIIPSDVKIGTDLSAISSDDTALQTLKNYLFNAERDVTFYCEKLKRWLEIRSYDLLSSDNKSEGKLFFFYDITRQREIFVQLKESEEMMAAIINFLPDPTFVIDTNSKVIVWNKAMEEMSGISSDKMLSKGNFAYALPLYGKKRPMLIDVALSSDNDYEILYKNIERKGDTLSTEVQKDGISLWCIAKPLYDKNGAVMGAIESVRNITDQKKTEAELQDRLDTLLKLNDIMVKREARISGLSEELKKQKQYNGRTSTE